MAGFYGQYQVTLDEKQRFPVPAKLRAILGPDGQPLVNDLAVLTKGMEGCLALYPQHEWEAVEARFSQLPYAGKELRRFSRQFFSLADSVSLDKNGRLMIPTRLITEAKLRKDLLVIGVSRWIEIWDPIRFEYYLEQSPISFEEAAERVLSHQPPAGS